ncbi:MAG: ribosome small subunit-dependent GTPase A [Myxococcales bacterium]|nr:ribosome small subunit-dependent GTPase A [Myxococcales bacterium]MDD9964918.1 ribosome small subunit-dependent GTPase A [Myxococcales bacterium]
MKLEDLGWAEPFVSALAELPIASPTPGRVTSAHRNHYTLLTVRAGQPVDILVRLGGRLRHLVDDAFDLPTVGDWVAARIPDDGEGVIEAVLPRRSALVRSRPAGGGQPQLIAANLDSVFVVCSLNEDFSPRRLERYLSLVWESGARPVILLSKLDLCRDLPHHLDRTREVAVGVPVHALSSLTAEGVDELTPYLAPGQAVALVGSSGVGKSTLVNALLGDKRVETGAIRTSDGRGRHTTSRRELHVLPSGALLIDTPGMREVGLWSDSDQGLRSAFDDVQALADACRFHDCGHQGEPGCEIAAAVERGQLTEARFRSFQKLQRELAFLHRQQDDRARREHDQRMKRVWKVRSRAFRQNPKR